MVGEKLVLLFVWVVAGVVGPVHDLLGLFRSEQVVEQVFKRVVILDERELELRFMLLVTVHIVRCDLLVFLALRR